MKSIEDLEIILVDELIEHLKNITSIELNNKEYYNSILGDTSSILAALLWSHLKKDFTEWYKSKWIDDSLLIDVKCKSNTLFIDGVMIWGIRTSTQQWVDLFQFQAKLIQKNLAKYKIMFCDIGEHKTITYEEFKKNRFYQYSSHKDWKYIVENTYSLNDRQETNINHTIIIK